jgi:hypothetical protein
VKPEPARVERLRDPQGEQAILVYLITYQLYTKDVTKDELEKEGKF